MVNGIAASNAELAAAKTVREKEATDYSKSEAELVEGGRHGEIVSSLSVGDQSPVSSKRHNFCSERPPVTPRGLRVLWCEGSVNGLCCHSV